MTFEREHLIIFLTFIENVQNLFKLSPFFGTTYLSNCFTITQFATITVKELAHLTELISLIYKGSLQLNNKNITRPVDKCLT